jgi:hypothetical protein
LLSKAGTVLIIYIWLDFYEDMSPWVLSSIDIQQTEPKATCCLNKSQPNAYKMYTDLEAILSACTLAGFLVVVLS